MVVRRLRAPPSAVRKTLHRPSKVGAASTASIRLPSLSSETIPVANSACAARFHWPHRIRSTASAVIVSGETRPAKPQRRQTSRSARVGPPERST